MVDMVDAITSKCRAKLRNFCSRESFYLIPCILTISLYACISEGTKPAGENSTLEVGDQLVWEEVQNLLVNTKEIVVLDGIKPVSRKNEESFTGNFGDWMVRHMLSDPQNLNPYTSNDAGSSLVLGHIFETLLYAENEPPYQLKGKLAASYPKISEDRLSYTFNLRKKYRIC